MNKTEKLIKRKMIDCDLRSFREVALSAGMKYDTFLTRLDNPAMFRAFEIVSLKDVLDLTDEDLLQLIKGE